jgi:hypothetical protein
MRIEILPAPLPAGTVSPEGTLVPAGDGWRIFVRRVEPDPDVPARALSRIATARLRPDFTLDGSWEVLRAEAPPTSLRRSWRGPRASPAQDGGFRLLVSVQEQDWPPTPDGWFSAWHQEEWRLTPAGLVAGVRHPVLGWNGIAAENNPMDELGWVPFGHGGRDYVCRRLSPLEVYGEEEPDGCRELVLDVGPVSASRANILGPAPFLPGNGELLAVYGLQDDGCRMPALHLARLDPEDSFRTIDRLDLPLAGPLEGLKNWGVVAAPARRVLARCGLPPEERHRPWQILPGGLVRTGSGWTVLAGLEGLGLVLLHLDSADLAGLLPGG